ncbi:MAG: O-methyltransferase [Actinobacteria bacterium]|nr:O-methyltransferase [Actinomycetota bacterium]
MTMTPERWRYLGRYSRELFGSQDDHLATMMDEAVAAGLPDISVTADVGRLLMILTSLTPGRLAIEVGTLAGYSGIWIARGLSDTGRLITIEFEPKHAEFARSQFNHAGVGSAVEVRVGAGIEVLSGLRDELAPGSVDVLFLDAVKTEYSDYFKLARPLIAPGGLVLADNVYATGAGWVDEGYGTDGFNRLVASDPDFEAVAVPLRQGILIARRNS